MSMKVKAVLLMACFAVLFCSQIEASAVVVSIPDTNAGAKEVVEVPVMVDDATGIAGFNFDITYDPLVLQASGTKSGELTTGWIVMSNTETAGKIKVTGVNLTLSELSGGKGSLVKIKFKIIDSSKKDTALGFALSSLTNAKGDKIPLETIPGKIKAGSFRNKK